MDYEKCIIDLMNKIHDKKLLKRVYNLLEYLYVNKDKEKEPLSTELFCDCVNGLRDQLESLDVLEKELIEIQKKTFELQRLIQIEKINISYFLGK